MIGTIEGFANPIPFTEEEKMISVRVWTPAAGTPILLKTEIDRRRHLLRDHPVHHAGRVGDA